MKRNLRAIILILIGVIASAGLKAQAPFSRGVNLTGWFQTSGSRQIQFTKYTKKDFENIKSLGCDVIRLPINLFYMAGSKPDYTVDPLFFSFLDEAINWAEELKLYLLLDNHSTDDIASKNADLENILIKVWAQVAARYKDRSTYIMYEIMNEPNGITTSSWCATQKKAIDAIRAIDTTHTLIVGPSNYNTYNDLSQMPIYSDKKLIYTFHFYDPMVFTHQGANWSSPSLEPLKGVPFPYDAAKMPVFPSALKGTWIESSFNNYSSDGTVAKIQSSLQKAVDFKNANKVNVYCGEFGVYKPYSNDSDRTYWYSEVRKFLEQNGIAWTTWDYQNTFGLFEKGTSEMFDYDINIPLIKALGLTEPKQDTFKMMPDTLAFNIYSDYIGEKIFESGYGTNATIDFYSTEQPNNDNYCLYWTGTSQYGAVGFNFIPDKDLSKLVSNNYALSFLVRGNKPGTKIEMRFIDSQTTDPNDLPWRMNFTVDETLAKWDNKWHKVFIPLKNFVDQGAWNGTWHNPEGKFDWKAVDKFEINNDQGALTNINFWFDNITITNMDTAEINDTSAYIKPQKPSSLKSNYVSKIDIFPNPVNEKLTINYNLETQENINIDIYNLLGRKLASLANEKQPSGKHTISWNLRDGNGLKVSDGVYICQVKISGVVYNKKISVQKK